MRIIKREIKEYKGSGGEPERSNTQAFDQLNRHMWYDGKSSFRDPNNSDTEIVSRDAGYSFQTIHYADGKTMQFYRIDVNAAAIAHSERS